MLGGLNGELIMFIAFTTTLALAAPTLTVDFLDVGQGDGVLLRTAEGKVILIDGGKPSGDADDQLVALGITKIDLLIASHADYDHAGVHESILANFDVVEYVTNGLSHTSQSYARITALASSQEGSGALITTVAADLATGEDLGWGDLHLWLIAPPETIGSTDQNLNSIGIMVEYGEFRSLITGDSERDETDAWLTEGLYDAYLSDIDVYKAIHHGSKDGDAGNTPWMDLVMPENVIVQVGSNSYGHPTAEALTTYSAYASTTSRTDTDGRLSTSVWTGGGYALSNEAGTVVFVSGEGIPADAGACPSTHPVKVSASGLYHVSTGAYYKRTSAVTCFASSADAAAAGYRASSR